VRTAQTASCRLGSALFGACAVALFGFAVFGLALSGSCALRALRGSACAF